MRCQNCGIEFDTRKESSDGTIVCPKCGTVYRKKAAVKNERKEYKPFNSSDPDSPHSSFWKWQIVAASILVIAIIAAGFFGVNRLLSDARKRRDLLTEPSPTAMQVPAASPTATPTPTPRPTPTPTQTPAPTPTRTPTPTPFPTYAAQTNYTYPTATPYNAAYPPIYATSTPYPYSYSYPTATPYYYYPTPTPTPAPTPTPITEVFLRELLNNGTPIQGYNWQNTALDSSDGTTRQVAFTDVTGDGVPELLYLRTAQNSNPRAEIRIGTYSNGSYREIYRFDQLDDRTGTHPYCFFQLKGDSALYAYLNDPNPYNNAKLFKLSTQSNGTFDGSYLMGMTASASSTQYNTMYGNCSETDFNGVLAQLRQNMDKVVFSGHMRSDGVLAIPAGYTNLSVTYEQAVSALISGTNLTSYYTKTDGIYTGTAAKTPAPQITPTPALPTAPVITPPPVITPQPVITPPVITAPPVVTPPVITYAPVITTPPAPTTPVAPPTAVPMTTWNNAFKDELTAHKDAIAKYNWQNGYAFLGEQVSTPHPVAFTDFTGDGQPDLLYVSSTGGNGAVGDSAQLKIFSCSDGSMKEVYSATGFDEVSQAFPEYCVFLINGDSSLYLYESTLNAYAGNFYFYKLTPQANGQLKKTLQLSATTSGPDTFECKNASGKITLQEFYIAASQLTSNINEVLLSGHLRDTLLTVPSSATDSSMTYDEAIKALNSVN